jgi:ethanolamine utilization protein EutQ (cupin superfamily)
LLVVAHELMMLSTWVAYRASFVTYQARAILYTICASICNSRAKHSTATQQVNKVSQHSQQHLKQQIQCSKFKAATRHHLRIHVQQQVKAQVKGGFLQQISNC